MVKAIGPSVAALILVLVMLDGALAQQKRIDPQENPTELLEQIYGASSDKEASGGWRRADKNWGPSGDIRQAPGFETLPLSSEMAALKQRVDRKLEKDGFVCIDYDMISDSQDPHIARYRITSPSRTGGGRAQYDIYTQDDSLKGGSRITWRLLQEDGKWRIDDIFTYSKDSKGLSRRNGARSMLRDCLKN